MQDAYQILQDTYGYADFRLNQAAIIESLSQGKDVLALMPTGGGKSLCYQIPALMHGGVGVVVSPLIALMQDQVEALQQVGIAAAFLNSTLDLAQVQSIECDLFAGKIQLLYVAPERLLSERMLGLLERLHERVGLALFAIDEAHCVSQWGHDFRPEYQQLSLLAQHFPAVPRIALTATADQRTRDEIISQLALQQADVYLNSFDRPNIHYHIQQGQNARQQLWQFIQTHHADDAGIVYCLSRKKVESTAAWLSEQGRTALPYHAGLAAEIRQQYQQRFLQEEGIIMVATIAFGMGIDKPDVRFVAHLSLPKSIEAYYQETGRAGRDGQAANAWMAYGLQDVISLRQMMQESSASERHKRIEHHKLEAMLALCEMTSCRRQALLDYFGETDSPACGNCDNCNIPPQVWDATVAAQKALSCVYRTGQRFGVNYVIEVLLGNSDARMQRFRHDQLSTFGIGSEYSQAEWRNIFRQLIALGLLAVDMDGHGGLRLSAAARPILRGEKPLHLRQYAKQTTRNKGSAKTNKQLDKEALPASVRQLWEALRDLRSILAKEQGVPPYIIFHDNTLLNMANERPQTLQSMRGIIGVGERKLELYGQAFLDVIATDYSD